jgi:hypothetical protein
MYAPYTLTFRSGEKNSLLQNFMDSVIYNYPMGFLCNLKIYVHEIPYVIMLQNNVIYANYFMMLVRPWLRDAIIAHDWGNNIMTIQGNGMVRTIVVTKHLGAKVKQPQKCCYATITKMVSLMKRRASYLLQNHNCFP